MWTKLKSRAVSIRRLRALITNFDHNIALSTRPDVWQRRTVRIACIAHHLMDATVLARGTHRQTHGQSASESDCCTELCYRLGFHTPCLVFVLVPHISLPSFRVRACVLWRSIHTRVVSHRRKHAATAQSLSLYTRTARICVPRNPVHM